MRNCNPCQSPFRLEIGILLIYRQMLCLTVHVGRCCVADTECLRLWAHFIKYLFYILLHSWILHVVRSLQQHHHTWPKSLAVALVVGWFWTTHRTTFSCCTYFLFVCRQIQYTSEIIHASFLAHGLFETFPWFDFFVYTTLGNASLVGNTGWAIEKQKKTFASKNWLIC